jgi:hypothetical protein
MEVHVRRSIKWNKNVVLRQEHTCFRKRDDTVASIFTPYIHSSVDIATRYRLDGSGIESRWGGEIFSTRPNRPWGLPSLLYNGYRVKRRGRGVNHPPPSSAEVRVESSRAIPLLPLWAFMACSWVNFTFTSTCATFPTLLLLRAVSKLPVHRGAVRVWLASIHYDR